MRKVAAAILIGLFITIAAPTMHETAAALPAAGDCGALAGPRPTGHDRAAEARKQAIAKRYYERKTRGESTEDIDLETRALFGAPGPTPEAAAALGKTLFVSWQQQQNGYYCGPASAWIVNNWNGDHFFGGRKTSLNEGWTLTQDNLASSSYLSTTTSGTSFSSGVWGNGLNKWLTGSSSWWYYLTWSPSLATYKADLVYDIDTDHPFVIDVHISHATGYLVGYSYCDGSPGCEWWHYVAVNGYYSYGDTTDYTDPYNTGHGSLGAHYGFSSATIVSLIAARGMIW